MAKVYTMPIIDEGEITGTPGAVLVAERELEYIESDLYSLRVGECTHMSKFSSPRRRIVLHGATYQKTHVHYQDAPFPFLVWERVE